MRFLLLAALSSLLVPSLILAQDQKDPNKKDYTQDEKERKDTTQDEKDRTNKDVPQGERELTGKDVKQGLCGEYFVVGKEIDKMPDFTNMTCTAKRVDANINFEGATPWVLPDVPLKEFFAVRWTGTLRVPKDDTYTFYLASDDGSKLFIDGKVVIDNDGKHKMDEDSKGVKLTAGDHDFRVDYFQNKDKAGCKLSWKYEGMDKHVVPTTVFWHKYEKGLDAEVK